MASHNSETITSPVFPEEEQLKLRATFSQLRPINPDDQKELKAYLAILSADTTRNRFKNPVVEMEELERRIQNPYYHVLAGFNVLGELIWTSTIMDRSEKNPSPPSPGSESGYKPGDSVWIYAAVHEELKRHGIASQAAPATIDWCFSPENIKTFEERDRKILETRTLVRTGEDQYEEQVLGSGLSRLGFTDYGTVSLEQNSVLKYRARVFTLSRETWQERQVTG